MTTLLNGLVGGLVVGVVASVIVVLVQRSRLPAGAGPTGRRRWQFAVAVLYGGLAGVGLVALELYALGVLSVPPATSTALGLSVAWSAILAGLLVAVVRTGGTLPFVDRSLRALLVYHLVLGVGMGGWIRLTWLT